MEMVTSFVYPPPPSILLNCMSVVGVAALANIGWSEIRGNHLKYSKFGVSSSSPQPQKERFGSISSRNGMLLLYTPAFLAAASSFFVVPSDDLRFLLLKSALALHFFKRVFEVLFIHKYSGGMAIDSALTISSSYFSSTALMLYSQNLTLGLTEPSFDMKLAGVVMFVVGIVGNLYHHVLLAKLRKEDGKKEYKIPKGGLFDIIICPHYLFEILVFWSFFLISQTIYSFSFAMGTMLYLIGRSYATRTWYLSKFDDFPKHIKALIPFVF
ncbi:steroid 5alpha-reductase-like protein [Arabidopsis thaliana]|jgi:very-long-chain enoyl-CoA reductase|uniref:3-oxo-5-alpha-steroid 4-dehydrogenase family protein n=1 Tax=Arabidopsis thaliana TaxID=3702 RepID=Q9LFS3_ARATH|nr:3-oxo-5-alpha-steroid 4-dehydrogenase family protein [Arabidopsis thaliana]AAK55737.1 AT5g16010/F1N13_150 [Arabidopsis thaliana]AAN64521.1 At5g16010/F1N13_150 [Arabidopsis thaliana]AED92234.1 3-oxo-5-alpha-steroid 4-dehydrogenase family protein [Arabidopsis thaliana]CAC01800.1 steroid 5alpha-reductase-like protein [Arabidopsis thaliana]|eukprot:NP_197105.1 3-oxo-5-alpha-steroid 4-dehydrogenase family protein [Arabidopsis thaliana]